MSASFKASNKDIGDTVGTPNLKGLQECRVLKNSEGVLLSSRQVKVYIHLFKAYQQRHRGTMELLKVCKDTGVQ